MKVEFIIGNATEARLFAEFMGKIYATRDPEGALQTSIAREVKAAVAEEAAAVMAEEVVEKAATKIDREELLTTAANLAKKSADYRVKVKAAISEATKGATLRECDESLLPAVKAALEAL